MKIAVNLRIGTNAFFGYLFYNLFFFITSVKEDPIRSEVWASYCQQTHYLCPPLIRS